MGADPAVLQPILNQYRGPLLHYSSRLVGPDRAQDVVQEAYCRLLAADAPPPEHAVKPWLFTVCRRLALDLLRKETPMPLTAEHDVPAPSAEPSAVAAAAEQASQLLRLLLGLPGNQQEVLRLKFHEDFSYKEIAAITGLSVSHVGVLIHQGIKTLRSRMRE